MFQPASGPRSPARFLAVSILIHTAGILLLFGLGLPGPLSDFREGPLHVAQVALVAPRLDPYRRARSTQSTQIRRPELSKVRPPPPRVFQPASKPAPEALPVPLVTLPAIAVAVVAVSVVAVPVVAVPVVAALLPRPILPVPILPAAIKTDAFAEARAPISASPAVIRAAGFDTAVAARDAAPPAKLARASAGFGDASVAAMAAPTRSAAAPASVTPVEILDKPRPAYTAEARRVSVEGEVLIEVLFEASGQTRVQRLVRGLGHGLDENAISAARQIRFRPARQEGVAVDSLAVVHILFQLAY